MGGYLVRVRVRIRVRARVRARVRVRDAVGGYRLAAFEVGGPASPTKNCGLSHLVRVRVRARVRARARG